MLLPSSVYVSLGRLKMGGQIVDMLIRAVSLKSGGGRNDENIILCSSISAQRQTSKRTKDSQALIRIA